VARIAERSWLARALHAEPGGVEPELLQDLPPELARDVRTWQERVRQEGWRLDADEWALGLLTLIRLATPARAAEAPVPESSIGRESSEEPSISMETGD
jgi:hypothetical protein